MLKINIGLSRKIGEANYGSRGASVNLELEVDGGLVLQPEELRKKMRHLFDLAKESVDEELSHGNRPDSRVNGRGTGNSQSNNGAHRQNGRHSTASQCRALRAIAGRRQLDLAAELQASFGLERPEDLSISEASDLIDSWKSAATANGTDR